MSAIYIVGAAVVVLYVLSSLIYKIMRGSSAPPTASVGIPLIGNYIEFASNPVAFIEKCRKKFGSIYTVPMLHKNLTFVLEPAVSAPFYQLDDTKMSQSEVYGFMTPVFGKGVVYDAEYKLRLQQMQGMATGLKSGRLMDYVHRIEFETIDYVKKWGKSGEIDILEALSELTILTSSRCLHGDEIRENMFAEVARIYHDLDKGVTPLSFFFPYAPTAAHALRDKAREEMVGIFSKVIQKRKAENATEDKYTDILQLYINFKYKDGTQLTDDQIVGLLIALLFAGQHTSSITSTWSMMYLIHNPQCLQRVLDEQKTILGDNTKLDFDSVGKMEFLQNCAKESLRMFPPLIMLMRLAKEDIKTTHNGKEFTIPKGDIVITSPAVTHRLSSVFTKPDTFDPDRFSPERNEQGTPFSYVGFGGGRHACLGQQFGLLQVKTIMSILVRNFKFEAIDKEFPEPDYTAMVVGPKNHCKVRYTKLASSSI